MEDHHKTDLSITQLAGFIRPQHELSTFLHHLQNREVADRILNSGFEFENHLSHTTDQVTGHDLIELGYIRNLRKAYGNIILVIQISNDLIHRINRAIMQTSAHFSEALTVAPPFIGENDFLVYTLPVQYISGYFDMEKCNGVRNSDFDPSYLPGDYASNISNINNRSWK